MFQNDAPNYNGIVSEKVAEMCKTAIPIKMLPKISKGVPKFNHPFSRFANKLGLGKLLPPIQQAMMGAGNFSVVAGRTKGIHSYEPGYKTFEKLSPFKTPKKARAGINQMVTAHEGIEHREINKLIPRKYQGTRLPVDITRGDAMKYIASNIGSHIKQSLGGAATRVKQSLGTLAANIKKVPATPAPPSPAEPMSPVSSRWRAAFKARSNPIMANRPIGFKTEKLNAPTSDAPKLSAPPVVSPEAQKVRDSLKRTDFFSHASPDVLLQEGNIAATLTGRNAGLTSDYIRKIRDWSGESKLINAMAKDLGYNNYQWGVNRISRHGRKKISAGLNDMFHNWDSDQIRDFVTRTGLTG